MPDLALRPTGLSEGKVRDFIYIPRVISEVALDVRTNTFGSHFVDDFTYALAGEMTKMLYVCAFE